jgi:uncharacterized protein (DUF362 family)
MVKVSLTKVDTDLYTAMSKSIDALGQAVINRGDHVLLKPNLVTPEAPDSGLITSPQVVEAAARYCLERGAAKVTIGEGPGNYNTRAGLKNCLTHTGISEITDRLGIEWALFDDLTYRTFKKVSRFTPDQFRISELVFNCDKLINLPVLKTHYLTKVTLSMKNLKGCLKWEDKVLFHQYDMGRAVTELNKIIRPAINIIDATHWKHASAGLLIAGSDIVAVDTVGCALMGIDPAQVGTVVYGAEAGLGQNDLTKIDILGPELKQLKFRVKLPQEELQEYFPLLKITGAEKACSGCLIPLLSSLTSIREQGTRLKNPLTICLGKNPQVPEGIPFLLVGDCAAESESDKNRHATGCAPVKVEVLKKMLKAMT